MNKVYDAVVELDHPNMMARILGENQSGNSQWAIPKEESNRFCLLDGDRVRIKIPNPDDQFCKVIGVFADDL